MTIMNTFSATLYDKDSPYIDQKTVESLSKEMSKIITDQIFQSMKDIANEDKKTDEPSE